MSKTKISKEEITKLLAELRSSNVSSGLLIVQRNAIWIIAIAFLYSIYRGLTAKSGNADKVEWAMVILLWVSSGAVEFIAPDKGNRIVKYLAIGAYAYKPLIALFLKLISTK